MPYYRITIWIQNKRKPVQGIRRIEINNVDVVFTMIKKKSQSHFNVSQILDVEVVMLPKSCTAVINYLKKKHNNKE